MEDSQPPVPPVTSGPRRTARPRHQTKQPGQPGAEVAYVPAPPVKRLYAVVIDFFIAAIPFGMLWELIFASAKNSPPLILHDVISWLVFALVTTLCTAKFGATIGKKIMKIRAVQHHNNPLTIYQFFLREFLIVYGGTSLYTLILILMISGLDPDYIGGFNLLYFPGFLVGLGFLLIFKKPYLPLHDRIFKTGVISTDPAVVRKGFQH